MRSSIKTKSQFKEYSDLILAILNDSGLAVKKDYGICYVELIRTVAFKHKKDYDLTIFIHTHKVRIRPNLKAVISHIQHDLPVFYDFESLTSEVDITKAWAKLINLLISDIDKEVLDFKERSGISFESDWHLS